MGAEALEALLAGGLHAPLDAEAICSLLGAHDGAGAGGLATAEQLARLLANPHVSSEHAGRHFVAVSLREAETLRAAIHGRRRTSLLPHAASSDARIGLRSIAHDGALLDASHQMPNLMDAQLRTACQIFRFVDGQTHFGDAELLALLRALGGGTQPLERHAFFHQVRLLEICIEHAFWLLLSASECF